MFNSIMSKTKRVAKVTVVAASAVMVLAACNDSKKSGPEFNSKMRVVHASANAPKVQLTVDGVTALGGATVDYRGATPQFYVTAGTTSLGVDAVLPGGDILTVIEADAAIEVNTAYDVFAIGAVGSSLESFIMSRDRAFDESQVRISVGHLAEGIPMVDVYATAPDADLDMASPLGSFSYKETLGPVVVPSGDYQIRVTLAGSKASVFDSGTLLLPAGADLTVAAVLNTSTSSANSASKSPVNLLMLNGDSASTVFSADDGAELRVGHNSAGTGAVDIVVNDNTDAPLVPGLTFPDFTGYVSVPADTYNVKVFGAGATENPAIEADLPLGNGVIYSVIALNEGADIEALVLVDDPRSIATEAKLRVIHGSSLAGDVDLYLTAEGADITSIDPVAVGFPFKGDSGYLSVAAGTYDITVTATGSKDAAIGPLPVMLDAGGVYTVIARDEVGLMGVNVTVLDDFLAAQ